MTTIQDIWTGDYAGVAQIDLKSFNPSKLNSNALQERAAQLRAILHSFREHVKSAREDGVRIYEYSGKKIIRYRRILREIIPNEMETLTALVEKKLHVATDPKGTIGETGLETTLRAVDKRILHVFDNAINRSANYVAKVLRNNPKLISREYTNEPECYDAMKKDPNLFWVFFKKVEELKGGSKRRFEHIGSQYSDYHYASSPKSPTKKRA